MKKIAKGFLLGIAFVAVMFFMSCSDVTPEERESQIIEQEAEAVDFDSVRCCYGGGNHGNESNGYGGRP